MGAKPQPCYNRIRGINDRVIMRLQRIYLIASDMFILGPGYLHFCRFRISGDFSKPALVSGNAR